MIGIGVSGFRQRSRSKVQHAFYTSIDRFMNLTNSISSLHKLLFRVFLKSRWILGKSQCDVFSNDALANTIQKILLINLNRHTGRLRDISREFRQVNDANGHPLIELVERFPAIDARSTKIDYTLFELEAYYSLADQLYVEPNDLIPLDVVESNQHIGMSKQEVAIALSHINVWRQVAEGSSKFVLVLEDDIYLTSGFANKLELAWAEIDGDFDLLYLSYMEARSGLRIRKENRYVDRISGGLWQLSGYVLSKAGAQKLLDRLPVRGPVDLWINFHFSDIDVYSTKKPIIEQRPDNTSSNSYSILPVLSKTGVLDGGHALFEKAELPTPLFGIGPPRTGLSSLASAISILGYRCCSDVARICDAEKALLFSSDGHQSFDSYVNIGALTPDSVSELKRIYPTAKFVLTTNDLVNRSEAETEKWRRVRDEIGAVECLVLPTSASNKWQLLCEFLNCNLPVCDFPSCEDLGQRPTATSPVDGSTGNALLFDRSPWIVQSPHWNGIHLHEESERDYEEKRLSFAAKFDSQNWLTLNETFPGNLAFFKPENLVLSNGLAELKVEKKNVGVRDCVSASIVSRERFRYGKFTATLKPPSMPGIVTGIFLHRNSPRHEIDIEILGKDPTKMLTNVYYNPGSEGTKFDYGYRGTPISIDLGFDASQEFHEYSIVWTETSIVWLVDGQLVHKRAVWQPTPIPDLEMQFYLNCWPSNSIEFAGELKAANLPVSCSIKEVSVRSYRQQRKSELEPAN